MSRYSLVKATHNGVNPVLYARNESGKKGMFVVKDFHPYFYTERNAGEGSYQSINGKIVRKIICDRPGDIPNVREQYVPHYEADIPFARRFLIDLGIHSYFEVTKVERELPDGTLVVKTENIRGL